MSLNVALGVLLIDILLSGDNAIVIALVCRSLSKEHRFRALWLGVIGAFLARLILTSSATLAMSIPFIKLVGGFLLLKISIEVIVDNSSGSATPLNDEHRSSRGDVISAAKTIILADIVMSLDNVLALSAVTQNNFQMLMVGLLVSIPILMFGSLYVSKMLDVFPRLLWIGAGILGGVSGSLIVEDPIFGDMFAHSTSMANLVVPLLSAIYVIFQSKIILENQPTLATREKPNSLFSIFRSLPVPPVVELGGEQIRVVVKVGSLVASDTGTPNQAERVDRQVSASVPIARTVASEATVKHLDGPKVIAGLVFAALIVGGLGYYVVTSSILPSPEGFKTYQCFKPQLDIAYLPKATKIRLISSKGIITAAVVEGAIVWNDYRSAALSLGVPPPTQIIFSDSSRMVVSGGMFEKTECQVAAK